MPHRIRYSRPFQVLELTARTLQGRFLLQPDDPDRLNPLIVGVIARAKRRYDIQVFAVVVLSNHLHILLAGPCSDRVSRFQNYVLSNIAREVGRLRGWSGPFWHRRGTIVPIVDAEAEVARLRYILSNTVKEQIVGHPFDWPGVHSAQALCTGGELKGVWVDRTAHYRCKRKDKTLEEFTEEENLKLDALPAWSDVTPRTYRARVKRVVEEVVQAHGGARRAKRRRLKRQLERGSPERRPRQVAESPAPLCHATTRAGWRRFRAEYRAYATSVREATQGLGGALLRAGMPPHGQLGAVAAGCTRGAA